jgi:hypothetical protein
MVNKMSIVNFFSIDNIKQRLVRTVTSPTLFWFYSLYLSCLLMMIINNLFRVGFTIDGLLGGPIYYSGLFFNYGLNVEGVYTTPYESGVLAWIIAPFIAIFLGVVLFFLKDSGFTYNGNTREMNPYLAPGNPTYAFFPEDVYGAGTVLFGMKGNLFYISIVWIPIIISSILTVYYSKWLDRGDWVVSKFFTNFIIALWIAIPFAKKTDPDLSFSFSGLIQSLFIDRSINHFVIYDGHYHPMMIAFTLTLFQFVPQLIYYFFLFLYLIEKEYKKYSLIRDKRKEYQKSKEGEFQGNLPWLKEKSKMKIKIGSEKIE